MRKDSQKLKELRRTGYLRNHVRKYSINRYIDKFSNENEKTVAKLDLDRLYKIQKKYEHNDSTMIIIIEYVKETFNGQLRLRYVEYLACLVKGENLQADAEVLKYIIDEKPLLLEMQKMCSE
ncbi:hypothetical protein [Bacillus thuringiensis]|uniref:hypothetical protein n=1 Tax=Bacillus thuringiensis TaxID=1428 RepID=UPI000BFDD1C2|nr:hypothetical protein [Bacillus thuringiensis]PGT62319.1 hypothetical protein COD16_09635 [Bacillus thuringiensis]